MFFAAVRHIRDERVMGLLEFQEESLNYRVSRSLSPLFMRNKLRDRNIHGRET